MNSEEGPIDFAKPLRAAAIVIGSVAACALVRYLLDRYLGERAPLSLFVIAVMICAATGGLWRGLTATAISMVVGQVLFVQPRWRWNVVGIDEVVQLIIFATVGTVVSVTSERLRLSLERERGLRERERISRDALRESEERFRLLVDGVDRGAIFVVDYAGRVRSWNLGAERLFGYSPLEAQGLSVSRLYDPSDADAGRPTQDMGRAAASGRLTEKTWRVRKDGSRFEAKVTITALRDPEGNIRGFAQVTTDVVDQAPTATSARVAS
ncbi:MAG: DUF4118 domain-containing protein [Tepidisphaeraceae bacterium]